MRKIALLLITILIFNIAYAEDFPVIRKQLDSTAETADITFFVRWKTQEPVVRFINDAGEVFDPYQSSDNTSLTKFDDSYYYLIKDAKPTIWSIEYQKLVDETFEVVVNPSYPTIVIDQFDTVINNDRLNLSFNVSGDQNVTVNYMLSATAKGLSGEYQLYDSTCQTNQIVDKTIDISSLRSRNDYRFVLKAWYTINQYDVFDIVSSETFAFNNKDYNIDLAEMILTVYPDENIVKADWSQTDYSGYKGIVAVFNDDKETPFHYTESTESGYAVAKLDPLTSTMRVDVSLLIDEMYSNPVAKSLDLNAIKLKCEPPAFTNQPYMTVSYNGLKNQTVWLIVNDKETEIVLNGDGELQVELVAGQNDCQLIYKDQANIQWVLQPKVYLDIVAPKLTMLEKYDQLYTTEDTIDLLGVANDAVKLTINDKVVQLQEAGRFSETVSLQLGENQFIVKAYDSAGNVSQYLASIYRTESGAKELPSVEDAADKELQLNKNAILGFIEQTPYFYLYISIGISALIIIYALLFWRKEKGSK